MKSLKAKASEAFSSILARNSMSYNDFHGEVLTGENNGEFQIWKLEKGTLRESYYQLQNCNLYSIMYLSFSH